MKQPHNTPLRYTDCLTLRNGELRVDAGLLREHLAERLYQWRQAGGTSPERAQSFHRLLAQLGKLAGRTRAQAMEDLQQDVRAMEIRDGVDVGGAS